MIHSLARLRFGAPRRPIPGHGALRTGTPPSGTIRLAAAIFSLGSVVPAAAGSQAAAPAAAAPSVPSRTGFSAERLARIDQTLQRFVDENRIPGAVALVLRDGRVAYERAVGWSDKESGRRMTPDAIFRIASQTKAVVSVATMMLVEEGKINLLDPITRWMPSFASATVSNAFDTYGSGSLCGVGNCAIARTSISLVPPPPGIRPTPTSTRPM